MAIPADPSAGTGADANVPPNAPPGTVHYVGGTFYDANWNEIKPSKTGVTSSYNEQHFYGGPDGPGVYQVDDAGNPIALVRPDNTGGSGAARDQYTTDVDTDGSVTGVPGATYQKNLTTGQISILTRPTGGGGAQTPTNPQIYPTSTSQSPTGWYYGPTGQAVNWDGSPYNGPGWTNGVKDASTSATGSPDTMKGADGNTYQWNQTTGKWELAPGIPIVSGPGSSPSGGGSYSQPTIHISKTGGLSGGSAAADTGLTLAQTQQNAYNAAQQALQNQFDAQQAELSRQFQAAQNSQDRYLQAAIFAQQQDLNNKQLKLNAANAYAQHASSTDIGGMLAWMAAMGGGSVQNAIHSADPYGALTAAALLPGAQDLEVLQQNPQTADQILQQILSGMPQQTTGGGGLTSGTTSTAGGTTAGTTGGTTGTSTTGTATGTTGGLSGVPAAQTPQPPAGPYYTNGQPQGVDPKVVAAQQVLSQRGAPNGMTWNDYILQQAQLGLSWGQLYQQLPSTVQQAMSDTGMTLAPPSQQLVDTNTQWGPNGVPLGNGFWDSPLGRQYGGMTIAAPAQNGYGAQPGGLTGAAAEVYNRNNPTPIEGTAANPQAGTVSNQTPYGNDNPMFQDTLTKQATVAMASGGLTRAPQMMVGDAPGPNPFHGARPEMVINPTHAPLAVVPTQAMGGMMHFAQGTPRYATGTVGGAGWDPNSAGATAAILGNVYTPPAQTTSYAPPTISGTVGGTTTQHLMPYRPPTPAPIPYGNDTQNNVTTPTTSNPAPVATPVTPPVTQPVAPVTAGSPSTGVAVTTGGLTSPTTNTSATTPATGTSNTLPSNIYTGSGYTTQTPEQAGAAASDVPYLQQVYDQRVNTPIGSTSYMNTAFGQQNPAYQQAYFQGLQTKYGIPTDVSQWDYARNMIGGLTRPSGWGY